VGKFKDSVFYHEAIHEINYPFGDLYLLDGFVIEEIHEGITFNWEEHGKKVIEDISYLYDSNGHDVLLIVNRINSYSIKPTDWKKFFKHNYTLKAYGVVSYSNLGYSIAQVERLFINTKTKSFKSLENAIEWAKGLSTKRMVS